MLRGQTEHQHTEQRLLFLVPGFIETVGLVGWPAQLHMTHTHGLQKDTALNGKDLRGLRM